MADSTGSDIRATPAVTDPDAVGAELIEAQHQREVANHESRNLLVLAVHQIVVRTGWIFKTESVIMPAFLDYVMDAGWLRSCLPVVNRFGHSVPPFLFARRLKNLSHKKWALLAFSSAMSVPFFVLAAIQAFTAGNPPIWLPAVFLILYGVFYGCVGLNQLCFGTVQGKLIRPVRFGRLLAISSFGGAIPAVLCALWLMPGWLKLADGMGYVYFFVFTAGCFLAAALLLFLLLEPADDHHEPVAPLSQQLRACWRIAREDHAFRRLTPVVLLFATIVLLFPHYQASARENLNLAGVNLMVWVVVQNISTGVLSLVMGWLADTRGNRLTLRWIIFLCALAPLAALVMPQLPWLGKHFYWVIFALLGVTPVGMKTLVNYTLEIGPPADHPRYLSTLKLLMAAPFLISPLVGWLVDLTGSFALIFGLGAALIFVCGLLTFRLEEPRHRVHSELGSIRMTPEN